MESSDAGSVLAEFLRWYYTLCSATDTESGEGFVCNWFENSVYCVGSSNGRYSSLHYLHRWLGPSAGTSSGLLLVLSFFVHLKMQLQIWQFREFGCCCWLRLIWMLTRCLCFVHFFYRHSKSRKIFRFITEVVNFLQYEIYYDNHISKVKLEENPVKHISEEASIVKRKRNSTSSNDRKRHEAFSSEGGSNYEGLQNVTIEKKLKPTYSNISSKTKRVMEEEKQAIDIEHPRKRKTAKGQDFLIEAEKNADKMETTQRVDETLIEEGKRTVELHKDGNLEEVLEILKNAKLDQKEVVYEFPHLRDIISMDWTENDSLIDASFDECELIDHIPICKTIDELIEFLITIRNERQE